MNKLPLEYSKGGFTYKQVYREGLYAIYEQLDEGIRVAFEVFEINENQEREMFNRLLPASESVPPATQWGKNAWTVYTLEKAMGKIEEMKQKKLEAALIRQE